MENFYRPVCKSIVLLCGVAPFVAMMPYMIRAWQVSPLDSKDWLYLLSGVLVLAVSAFELRRRAAIGWEFRGLLIMFFAGFVIAAAGYYRINAVAIGASVVMAWGAVLWTSGWRLAFGILPSFGCIALSCTGSNYWLTAFTGVDGFLLKLGIVFFLLLWQIRNYAFFYSISPGRACFPLFLIFIFAIYFMAERHEIRYDGQLLELEARLSGAFTGREVECDAADLAYWRDNPARRFYFVRGDREYVDVLTVPRIKDVHKVHPPGHCIRAGGGRILAERTRTVLLSNGHLEVDEVRASFGARKMCMWTWYSSPLESTGNFITFRKHFRRGANWRMYQVAAPDNHGEGEKILHRFIEESKKLGKK